jgi:hypothetical protein
MEELHALVAASFARYGIESPADISAAPAVSPSTTQAGSPIEPTALPEHTYRRQPEPGLAT